MRMHDGNLLFSPSDLVNFLGCTHAISLDLQDLVTPLPRAVDNAQALLLQDKGHEHERAYLEQLKAQNLNIVEIDGTIPLEHRCIQTHAAMEDGADVIYQATLMQGRWHGYADFLRRVDLRTKLGSHGYEVVDTKLSRSPKPYHIVQLSLYADLLLGLQGVPPQQMHLILGDGAQASFRIVDFRHYVGRARRRFEVYTEAPPPASRPEPCQQCERCRWRELCGRQWEQEDHLSLVANIQRTQTRKLEKAGITTVRELAGSDPDLRVPDLAPDTFERLRSQALLQVRRRETGENQVELLSYPSGKGFARLPHPDPGDLFFDMEGDPLHPDGLEYLFGFHFVDNGKPVFRPFWAHDDDQERRAFQDAIDFVVEHLRRHPDAHVYHYAAYEESAIKRLSTRYGTRESEVDNLLRRRKLVDLYKIIREAIRVSEPSYSIKDLEVFYMEGRAGAVTSGGQSIVVYEQYRRTGDASLLQQISDYNEQDCRSTRGLRDWLLTLRPADAPWFSGGEPVAEDDGRSERQREAEERRKSCEERLLAGATEANLPMRRLIAQLLEFHRREAKSQWWAMFERQDASDEDLINDIECIGGLTADPTEPPEQVKRSFIFSYRLPPQDTKLRPGDGCLRADTLEYAGEIVRLDADLGGVAVKRGTASGLLPQRISLIPKGPYNTNDLTNAIYRFAEALVADDGRYPALIALLQRVTPRLRGRNGGVPIITPGEDVLSCTIEAARRLDGSYLFIQGPPGAGKTFTSSHIIVDLVKAGKRVGVASNSHKAINNLLAAVETRAVEVGVRLHGQKKSSAQGPDSFLHGRMIEDITSNKQLDVGSDIIGGTAWLFAQADLDQSLDYLFVDEAGQVSLANLIAMGVAARNIVLVGDQMQLAQPIQGVHPGESGLSALDYLLQGAPTVAPDRGIFLPTTWRMHEQVCRFISDAVYDSQLHPESNNHRRVLVLDKRAHPELRSGGLRFLEVSHTGCSQKSDEEAALVCGIWESLLQQRFQDRDGRVHQVRPENILVVSPYNLQVNHLRSCLPEGARVGTVDKFQGQEAEVVLISLVTSSSDDLPRQIEFLYSRNRLNVAVSRARSLAVVIANPRLLDIACRTVDQMRLVNTLCWAREYAVAAGAGAEVA